MHYIIKIMRYIRLVELAIPEIKIDASEVVKNGLSFSQALYLYK